MRRWIEILKQPRWDEVRELEMLLEQRTRELATVRQEIRRTGAADDLTGLPNYARFQVALRKEWGRALRDGTDLAIVHLAVDHYTAYHDRFGREVGDWGLARIGKALSRVIRRPGDLLARDRDAVFVAVLANTPLDGAVHVATRMCQAIDAEAIPHPTSPTAGHVTISAGVSAVRPSRDSSWEDLELVDRAGRALAAAQRSGPGGVATERGPVLTPSWSGPITIPLDGPPPVSRTGQLEAVAG